MSTLTEPTKCACGLAMVRTKRQPEFRICPNCDVLQSVELQVDGNGDNLRRIPTAYDHRFTLRWKQRIADMYRKPNN